MWGVAVGDVCRRWRSCMISSGVRVGVICGCCDGVDRDGGGVVLCCCVWGVWLGGGGCTGKVVCCGGWDVCIWGGCWCGLTCGCGRLWCWWVGGGRGQRGWCDWG